MTGSAANRIAVIDDDHDIRVMLRLALELAGYEVLTAQNGQEALELLRQSAPVALLLLDLKMPTMNGWQFRERQLEDPALREVPVLILSGDVGLPEAARALGAAGYLHKPVDLDALLDLVAASLGPRAAPP